MYPLGIVAAGEALPVSESVFIIISSVEVVGQLPPVVPDADALPVELCTVGAAMS